MNSFSLILPSKETTFKFGQWLGNLLPEGMVLLLQGNLGTGKTTFVQGLGAGLEVKDAIVSPTFALVNEYHDGRVPLYHFDLYRLEPSGLAVLNMEGYWEGNDEVAPGIVAIEWPERLGLKPPAYIQIDLDYAPEDQRRAKVDLVNLTEPLRGEIVIGLAQFADP